MNALNTLRVSSFVVARLSYAVCLCWIRVGGGVRL